MTCFATNKHVVKATDYTAKKTYLYLLRCKLWTCEYCGHVNKLQWVAKISNGVDAYQNQNVTGWQFITLTSHPKLRTRDSCLWVGPKAWKKLSSRMRYAYKNIHYVKIPELHKNGRVHWHLLASGGVTTAWLKKNAPKCGYGYIVESDPVRDGYNSVLYISKELSKQLGVKIWPKGLRRIATTHQWPELPSELEISELELDWNYIGSFERDDIRTLVRKTELLSGHDVILIDKNAKYE